MLRNVVILTMALALAGPVWAQTKAAPAQSAATADAPMRVGVINIQQAIASTDAGKQAMTQLQSKFAPRQASINNLAKKMQDLQQRLQAGANTLSDSEKNNLQFQYQTLSRNYQREQQEYQADAQDAQTDAMDAIGQKMMPLINRYAAQHNLGVVLDTSSSSNTVLYAANSVIITSAIVRLYDQQFPVKSAAAPAPKK